MDKDNDLLDTNTKDDDLDLSGLDDNAGLFDSFDDFGGEGQPPINKYSDLLKELTNFDPIVQRRIRNWLGLEWDETVRDYIPKKSAIINEKGARWAIGCLETYQSKPNIITNQAKQEYTNMQLEIVDLCWLIFPTKFDDFEVKDVADQWRLSNELQHSAFLVLAGTGDGKYTKFLGETHSVQEHINVQPTSHNQSNRTNENGFFGGLKNKLLGRQ